MMWSTVAEVFTPSAFLVKKKLFAIPASSVSFLCHVNWRQKQLTRNNAIDEIKSNYGKSIEFATAPHHRSSLSL